MPDPITVAEVTPENITRETVLRLWSSEELRRHMKNPEMRQAIERVLGESLPEVVQPEPAVEPVVEVDEQAAKEAADAQAAQVAAEEKAKAEAAAEEARKAEIARKEAEEAAKPKKFVFEFQARDEDGNPIGRPTHLEAPSQELLNEKIKTSYENAVRALTRLKRQKEQLTYKKEEPKKTLSVEEQIEAAKALDDKDPAVKLAAVRKITNADEIEKERQEAAAARDEARRERETYKFMKAHVQDFNPCQANAEVLGKYLMDNNLEWTANNLEVAFAESQDQMAEVPKKEPQPQASAPVVDNTPTVQPTVTPAAEPVVVATVPPVKVENPPAPVASRRAPDIQPGQLSGNRPIAKPAGLTKAEIKSWTGEQMRREMRNPLRRAEIDKVLSSRTSA